MNKGDIKTSLEKEQTAGSETYQVGQHILQEYG